MAPKWCWPGVVDVVLYREDQMWHNGGAGPVWWTWCDIDKARDVTMVVLARCGGRGVI